MWDGGPIPGELGKFPGYLIARLGEASRRRFHKALEPEGLHPRDFGVMTMVHANPGTSQQQLHERTGIDPSSMVAVIDMLEARGLAERRSDPADRRARAIYLTDDGERALARIGKVAARLQGEMFGGLSQEELTTLHRLLLRLAETAPRGDARARGDDAPAAGGACNR